MPGVAVGAAIECALPLYVTVLLANVETAAETFEIVPLTVLFAVVPSVHLYPLFNEKVAEYVPAFVATMFVPERLAPEVMLAGAFIAVEL